MSRMSKPVLLAFVAATLLGTCLHFLYDLLPCPLTALLAPVSESLWEHVKLLYWPTLVAALLLSRGRQPGTFGIRCLCLLIGTALMLMVGFIYHVSLGGDQLWVDIALYVLVMAVAFLLPTSLTPARWADAAPLLVLLTAALGVALLLFTFLPPSTMLFRDLSHPNC